MHIVPEDQKRPNKGRTGVERMFRRLNDLVMAVQLICWLIYTASVTLRSGKTLGTDMWAPSGFSLSPVLEYKLANCSYTTSVDLYAFTGLNITLTRNNSAEIWADFAGQLRLIVVISAVALTIGAVNKLLFNLNKFHWRYHNLYLHKDIVSAAEFVFLAYQVFLLATIQPLAALLQNYLRFCGAKQSNYLPFVSSTPLWVAFAVAAGIHFLSLCCLLWNALPKVGMLEEDEDVSNPPVWRILQSILDDEEKKKEEALRAKRAAAVALGNTLRSDGLGGTVGSQSDIQTLSLRMQSPRSAQQGGSIGGGGVSRKGTSVAPPPPPPTFFDRSPN